MKFNLFKRNKPNQSVFSKQLFEIQSKNSTNLTIFIFIKDQILFQIFEGKNTKRDGFQIKNKTDYVELHFFNKNKTLTYDKLVKFQESELRSEFFYFEEPKGNHNFIKSISSNPHEVEKRIHHCFKNIYDLTDLSEIKIEFADYNKQ